jgi:hypothetical protein
MSESCCPGCQDRHGPPALIDDITEIIQGDTLHYTVTGVPGKPEHSVLDLTLHVHHPGGGYTFVLQVANGALGGWSFLADEHSSVLS